MINNLNQATTVPNKIGFTKIYCGSMYSGKTRRLLDDLERLQYAKQTFQLFKPQIDQRYSRDNVTTHTKSSNLPSLPVNNPEEILTLLNPDTHVVGIDEVQFFDISIISVIKQLEQMGKRVIVSGLDLYSTGKPWLVTQHLLSTAKYVEKVHAYCVDCGDDAYISYSLETETNINSQINIGSTGKYIPLCQTCVAVRSY